MIVFPPTYGMRCVTCMRIVEVGTPIGINEKGCDFVEHPECAASRIVNKVLSNMRESIVLRKRRKSPISANKGS